MTSRPRRWIILGLLTIVPWGAGACDLVEGDSNDVPEDAEVQDSQEFEDDINDRSHRFATRRDIYVGNSVDLSVVVDENLGNKLFRIGGRLSTRPMVLVAHEGSLSPRESAFYVVEGDVVRLNDATLKRAREMGVYSRRLELVEGELVILAKGLDPV